MSRDYARIGHAYAERIAAGRESACRWVQLACGRQLADRNSHDSDWTFRPRVANKICEFIELLPHVRGQWKTPNIQLAPWQCFFLTTLFGWVGPDGYRRFRKALILVPRKNAKTTIAAGVGLYLLALDGEPGSEVYSAATTRDQARICWDIAKLMTQRSPGFRETWSVDAGAHAITVEPRGATFKPLSRDVDTLSGLNPHGVIIDELHAHKTREVFDVLDDATGSRRQPLMFCISTEGDNSAGILAEQVAYGQQVLEGAVKDPSFFPLLYTLDQEDDWTDRDAWRKANPNLGVSVFEDGLALRCQQAIRNPASQASFLTTRLNLRVGAGQAFFNMLAWRELCLDPKLRLADFYGARCKIAFDLASRSDIAAKCILFRRGPDYILFGAYYLPEDVITRGHPNYDLYRGWASAGLLTLTPGSITDYEFIEEDLIEDMKRFAVGKVAVDPYNATQFNTRMASRGVPINDVPQNVQRLSDPMKELGALITSGRVRHNGDPIMAWCMGNVCAKVDARENVFPRKARDENKIDFALAAIMALGEEMRDVPLISAWQQGRVVI